MSNLFNSFGLRPRTTWMVAIVAVFFAAYFAHRAAAQSAAAPATAPASVPATTATNPPPALPPGHAGAPAPEHGTAFQRTQAIFGLFVFIGFAYLIGRVRGYRTGVPWRCLTWGIILQFAFALFVLYVPDVLLKVQEAIQALLDFSDQGARVVFGNLVDYAVPVNDANGRPVGTVFFKAVFAFKVLPTIIFFATLTAVAYHSGIMQYVVQGLAWVMSKSMGTSGAETLSAAANIFVGQTEAPLMVKPFMAMATRSELMCIMVGGFANIASGVLGLYTDWLQDFIRNVGGHLAAACLISAPASLLVSKLMVPETEKPVSAGGVEFKVQRIDANIVDAASRGATEGLALALNVAAMLIAFTALVALFNWALGSGTAFVQTHFMGVAQAQVHPVTLETLLGYLLAPLAWLTGVPWADCHDAGSLLGIKTVLNELIAYSNMRERFLVNANFMSPRSAVITAYALCGFANFASVGIQIGGISTLAPERRPDLSRLGLLAMLGGAIASMMTACTVGALL